MTLLLCASSFQQHLKVESEIWDLEAKSGLFWDHFGTLVPFGTKSRIRDLIGAPDYLLVLGIGGAAKLGTTVTVCLWRSTTTSYAARSPLSTRGTLISRWGTLFLPGLAKTW